MLIGGIHRSHMTMAKHLWILGRLLTMKIPIKDSRGTKSCNKCIFNHVITTCYPKIFGWLQNKILSLPYITSLKEVTTFQFDECLSLIGVKYQ